MRFMSLYIVFFLCFIALGAHASPVFNKPYTLVNENNEQAIPLHLSLAITDAERQKGLMHVKAKEVGANEGMLFIWPFASLRYFWMKNTSLPLDIIFFNKGHVVGFLENMTPYDETPKSIQKGADMALEMPAGFVEKYSISTDWYLQVGHIEK